MRRLNLWSSSVAVLLVLTAMAAIAVSHRGSQPSNDPRIFNSTTSLVIESITEVESSQAAPNRQRTFKLILRNGYTQPVVAYSFRQLDASVPGNSFAGFETNGATNGWVLPPNATDTTYFSAPTKGEIVLTLEAVVLEDGTAEGEIEAVSRIRDVRAGVKMAYDRIVPLLRGAATSSETVAPDEVIQSVDNQVSALPQAEIPPNLRRGFHEGKQFVITNWQELRSKFRAVQNFKHRAEIAKFAQRVDEIRAKMKDASSR